ncbi:hypothetical protein MP228_003266 [Amoeboaphelidium protococcarum]|nr:hypothetical protein MP228_003266 [Amoeboaphelidium protococcarum]
MNEIKLQIIKDNFFESPMLLSKDLSYVDYVVEVQNTTSTKSDNKQVEQQLSDFIKLLSELLQKFIVCGLKFQIESANATSEGDGKLLVLIHCPDGALSQQYQQSRIDDWMKGVGDLSIDPVDKASLSALKTLSKSERYRLIHEILVRELTNYDGRLEYDLYPLHDDEFNQKWIKSWSSKWILNFDDLKVAREHFGEELALYFDFLQTYFFFLAIPSVLGVLAYFIDTQYSVWYSVTLCLWAVVFILYWERRQDDLVTIWNVKGCSKVDSSQHIKNDLYQPRTSSIDDCDYQIGGGGSPRLSPAWAAVYDYARKCATIPVMVVMAIMLSLYVSTMFILDMLLIEYYKGPLQEWLKYSPIIIYTLTVPYISQWYAAVCKLLNQFEQHQSLQSKHWYFVQKMFISNFVINFAFPLLNGLVYIPFGPYIAQLFGSLMDVPVSEEVQKTEKFANAVFEFIMTGQVINAFTELVLPVLQRAGAHFMARRKSSSDDNLSSSGSKPLSKDSKSNLQRILAQVEKASYDIDEDYNEMIMQFGYVVIFGSVWSFTSLAAFVNNWLEVRSDAIKIAYNHKRPVPRRTDSIGPWLFNLKLLTFFSVILNVVWICMFRQMSEARIFGIDINALASSKTFFWLFLIEHLFLVSWLIMSNAFSFFPSLSTLQAQEQEQQLRRKLLQSIISDHESQFDHLQVEEKDGQLQVNGNDSVRGSALSLADLTLMESEITEVCSHYLRQLLTSQSEKKVK